ncbi:MAG TPA: preprotein translocase subunit SecG [Chitinophagales bacterium]|nr:preprotein translocase subunit SecG [Chitinophagales bacterium]HMX03324.1 preprotein translocase subunit SecG [Chitinophagales bacterium]HMZ87978.1 preprotein translocase subunit SecG [Chitinophagales bacterium]HNA57938.1 preprotein translocase subunit SecG [Chitinophagales bacterium]HNE44735.1 preprotein translocase subunit SecG [Chitinophagales bacterium]
MLFTVIIIIAIIAAVLLGLVVLIQNPKGGGLSGTFGGAANQIFGYKRTTDDIEKITWILVAVVFVLCLSASALKPVETVTQQGGGLGTEAKMPTNVAAPAPDLMDEQSADQPGDTAN